MLLKHSFTVKPLFAPARACLQTGQYATQHGVWRNRIALNPERKTLAHHFIEPATTRHISVSGTWQRRASSRPRAICAADISFNFATHTPASWHR
jgi:hypothetical protein